MEFTGRITADAKFSTVKGNKELVTFSVALNDRYRDKATGETKEFVTFINIAWWKGTGIAKILKKGAIVTVVGRLSVNGYTDKEGRAKASITCHANEIKLIQSKKSDSSLGSQPAELTEPIENLPF